MAGRGNQGVKPEGVDRCPGEEIAVVGPRPAHDFFANREFLAEKHPSTVVFHEQHPHQKHDH